MQGPKHLGALAVPWKGGEAPGSDGAGRTYPARPKGMETFSRVPQALGVGLYGLRYM